MVELRQVREGHRNDVPLYFEGVELRPWIRSALWAVGLSSAVAGIIGMVLIEVAVFDAAAAILASVGAIIIAVAVRCRRFEITIGRSWLRLVHGPFKDDVARNLVGQPERRPATSWRRCYADEEVAIQLGVGDKALVVPTGDPDDFMTQLQS